MKNFLFLIGAFFLFIAAFLFFKRNEWKNYNKESFTKLTGIKKFQFSSDIHQDLFSYVAANVRPNDKATFLKKHYFFEGSLMPRRAVSDIPLKGSKNNYVYYLDEVGYGYLGYVVYLVSKKENEIVVYQRFGD